LQHWLGLAYFKAGRNDAALAALQRSEVLDGTQFDIHFDLALVLLQQNQSGPAAEELEKVVKLQPSHALAHVLLGRAYQNTNRTLQAVEQFQTAVRADPNTPLVHYHLAFAYASLGHNPEAIAEYKKELVRARITRRFSTSSDTACWNRKLEEAITLKAMELVPPMPTPPMIWASSASRGQP
jgi:Tfp pilus assembly protein PilF